MRIITATHSSLNMTVLISLICVIDRKFALKSRLTGSLQITMDVIKQNVNNFKVLHPALLVIKLCTGSSKYRRIITLNEVPS